MMRGILACGLLVAAFLPATASIEEADRHLADGDWKAARDAYAALTESVPAAWFGLARAQAQLGAHDEAIEALMGFARSGAVASLQVARTPELAPLREHERFAEVLHALRPCRSEEHRQFDFWLGDWEVHNRATPQSPPTHNRISVREGDCVVPEEYDTPAGYTGVSLSFYDAGRKRWHQTWMDNQGAPILHSGGLVDGKMILIDDPKATRQNRPTWTSTSSATTPPRASTSDCASWTPRRWPRSPRPTCTGPTEAGTKRAMCAPLPGDRRHASKRTGP